MFALELVLLTGEKHSSHAENRILVPALKNLFKIRDEHLGPLSFLYKGVPQGALGLSCT